MYLPYRNSPNSLTHYNSLALLFISTDIVNILLAQGLIELLIVLHGAGEEYLI